MINRKTLITILIVIVIGLLLSKSCHFVPIEQAKAEAKGKEFNAKDYARKVWNEFMKKLDSISSDASIVLEALIENKEEAEKKYGKVVGFTYNTLFLIKGKGKIVSIDDEKVLIQVEKVDREIYVSKDLIFGNDIVNSSGLVKMSDFDRIYDFNAVSNEINNIVNTEVVPPFMDKVKIGRVIEFVGVLNIPKDEEIKFPLQLLPVKLNVE
ncbi:MAG: hypothetical protein PWQ48_1693 [Thermotogaceae bacterium]|nr:hypothetical protein [Thermotogaceae bacterium]